VGEMGALKRLHLHYTLATFSLMLAKDW
jgi:hypothetical protein